MIINDLIAKAWPANHNHLKKEYYSVFFHFYPTASQAFGDRSLQESYYDKSLNQF